MKTFSQMLQEFPHDDKLNKLRHASVLSPKRQKQLSIPLVHFEDFDYEVWQSQYPPSNTSLETFNELKYLQALQHERNDTTEDMIFQDKDVLGSFKKYLDEHELEVDIERLKEVYEESGAIILMLKQFYARPRPKKLAKSLGVELTEFQLKTSETPSYPSGHAVQGRLLGKLIADEVPLEHRANILDLGERIGYNRQVAGAHYKSDTVFGHRLADELYRTVKIPVDLKLEDVIENINQQKEYKLLSEGSTGASTDFEGVRVACHNLSALKPDVFKKKILTVPIVKSFLKKADGPAPKKTRFATNGKSEKEKAEILYQFSQVCKKQFGGGKSDAGIGQSNAKVSSFWTRETDKATDVSKTDIKISGHKASVKGPQAQLMSGKKKETKATILAAAEASGRGATLRKSLLQATDKFVETTSVGQEMTTNALKKLSPEEAKRTGNAEAKKIVETQQELKDEVKRAFTDAFKDQSVAYEFAKEAMTGWEKFGGKSIKQDNKAGDTTGEATHMLVWSYDMDRVMFKKIDKSIINHSAKNMNINPSFKSNSKKAVAAKTPTNPKGKVGYSIFQTLRIETEQLINKQGEFVDQANEQVKIAGNQLNEGLITEVDFKGIASKVWNWLKKKFTELWSWFVEKIKAFRDKIVELLNNSPINDILDSFEGDVSVRVNPVVRFKI